jgi:hypothetical protein
MVSLAKAQLSAIRPEIGLKPVSYVYVEPRPIIVVSCTLWTSMDKRTNTH